MTDRPTPETDDVAQPSSLGYYEIVDAKLARRLERERDDAREALREIAEASGFDNIENWARNKARKALEEARK